MTDAWTRPSKPLATLQLAVPEIAQGDALAVQGSGNESPFVSESVSRGAALGAGEGDQFLAIVTAGWRTTQSRTSGLIRRVCRESWFTAYELLFAPNWLARLTLGSLTLTATSAVGLALGMRAEPPPPPPKVPVVENWSGYVPQNNVPTVTRPSSAVAQGAGQAPASQSTAPVFEEDDPVARQELEESTWFASSGTPQPARRSSSSSDEDAVMSGDSLELTSAGVAGDDAIGGSVQPAVHYQSGRMPNSQPPHRAALKE